VAWGSSHVEARVSILTRPEGRVLRRGEGRGRSRRSVSILTRPEGRVLQTGCYVHNADLQVSILTRPEGRVLRSPPQGTFTNNVFQSSPDPKVGCYRRALDAAAPAAGFQSSPDPKVGCYFGRQADRHRTKVSILTRPEGRVLQMLAFSQTSRGRFQSSPDPKVGCYSRTQTLDFS